MRRFLEAEGVAVSRFFLLFGFLHELTTSRNKSLQSRQSYKCARFSVLGIAMFIVFDCAFVVFDFRSFLDELEYFRKHRSVPIIKIRNEKNELY